MRIFSGMAYKGLSNSKPEQNPRQRRNSWGEALARKIAARKAQEALNGGPSLDDALQSLLMNSRNHGFGFGGRGYSHYFMAEPDDALSGVIIEQNFSGVVSVVVYRGSVVPEQSWWRNFHFLREERPGERFLGIPNQYAAATLERTEAPHIQLHNGIDILANRIFRGIPPPAEKDTTKFRTLLEMFYGRGPLQYNS